MRNLGGILILVGVIGFFYCSSQLEGATPPAPDTSLSEAIASPGGRWEFGRYACAGAAGIGVILALFPKGR
jgi:hypothetical protein